jgi:hypothetical protein
MPLRAPGQGFTVAARQWAGCDDCRMRVLVPPPDRDFDVTEVAVPWRVLRGAGHQVVFATEQAGTFPAAPAVDRRAAARSRPGEWQHPTAG